MKRFNFKPFALAIKTLFGLFLISIVCFFLLAMKVQKLTDDVWKQLGLNMPDGNKNILTSFKNGRFYYYGARNARNIVAGNRVAIVNELATHAKKYAASEDFKKEYQAYRASRKPAEYQKLEVPTVTEIKAQEKERIENAIKATEANANHPNSKVKNAVPYRLEALKKELTALEDPNNRVIKQKIDQATRYNEQIDKQYQQALQKYETDYPENPQLLIKKRLQDILAITSDVDYDAELKDAYNKKVFVNPLYERKPLEWKLAFRAGKPATDAVRAFAEQWLKQLN